jgi:hypothetical protein
MTWNDRNRNVVIIEMVNIIHFRKNAAKFGDSVVVEIKVKVFWLVMLCSVVKGYQHSRGPCCLALLAHHNITQCHNQEDINLKGNLTFILLLVTELEAITECTHFCIICQFFTSTSDFLK